MKFLKFIPAFLVFMLLTACPSSRQQNVIEQVKKNKMNLPDIKTVHTQGIHFKLSSLFFNNYYDFTHKKNAFKRNITELNLYFSVEKFDKNDISKLQFYSETEKNNYQIVHEFYINKRLNTLIEYKTSLKNGLPKEVGYKGIIQYIDGTSSTYNKPNLYMIATVEIDNNCYVFQFIGPKKNMSYFHDDFIRILKSINK